MVDGNFSDPVKNVATIGVQPGQTAADFGAGSGTYTLALARAIEGGMVKAIDVQKDLLGRIADQAAKSHLRNVEVVWGDFERAGGSRLRDRSCDLVVIANSLFQLAHKYSALKEAHRVLKPAGRLALIDWSDSFGHLGPHPDQVVKPAEAREMAKEAGFELAREFQAGAHHWGLIFTPLENAPTKAGSLTGFNKQ